jgi:glucose-1-phosphate cytidylyltransferase
MKLVIMAGGIGTRISEESYLKPKPMVEIGDMPIIWHILKYYSYFGYNDFIICCGYKGYVIKEYFANYFLHRSDVTFDFSQDNKMIVHSNVAEPWKVTLVDTGLNTMTGGRIKRIQKYVENEPFMVTYGDGVADVDLKALVLYHKENKKTVTLTAVQPGGRFGTIEADNSGQVKFLEKRREDGGWINGGFMILQPDVFKYLENDSTIFEKHTLEVLSNKNELAAFKHYGFWQCMDTLRDKNLLDELIEKKKAPWMVW